MTLAIDPEFRDLLPPLLKEQRDLLEADIAAHGCLTPIAVWNGAIVDGHHRYEICQRLGVPFNTLEMAFGSRLEAKQWALNTQKARRNLSAWEIGQIALKLKPEIEARAKENLRLSGEQYGKGFRNSEKPIAPVNTTTQLAEAAGIHTDTMSRVIQIDRHAPEPVKQALENRDVSINRAYQVTRAVKDLPPDEAKEKARTLLEADYKAFCKDVDREHAVANSIGDAIAAPLKLAEVTENDVRIWMQYSHIEPDAVPEQIETIDSAIANLNQLKKMLFGIRKLEVIR